MITYSMVQPLLLLMFDYFFTRSSLRHVRYHYEKQQIANSTASG